MSELAELRTFSDIVDELREQEETWHRNKSTVWGMTTGFPTIDRKTGGLHRGDVVVLGAQTGHGKTSLGNQIVFRVAMELKRRTEESGEYAGKAVLFSPEMREEQIFLRQACLMSGVRSWDLHTGQASDEERASWQAMLDLLLDMEPYLTVQAGQSVFIEDIQSAVQAERIVYEDGTLGSNIRLLAIDYVQRVLSRNARNTYERVTSISREIKDLANKNGFPVLAMAQLNREVQKSVDMDRDKIQRKPRLSDLQNTAGLEQDADAVWLIHRVVEDDAHVTKDGGEIAYLIFAKQRHGPRAEVELIYNAPLTMFEDPLWRRVRRRG